MHSRTKTHNGAALEAEAEHALESFKDKAAHVQQRLKAGVANTESAIKDHPFASVGIAAGIGVGVGLLVGLLMRRD